jgi:hypothetical protein
LSNKIKFEWELIFRSEDKISNTWRAKVIGGWLLRDFHCIYVDNFKTSKNATRDYTLSNAVAFVPDPNHEWGIDNPTQVEQAELATRTDLN